MVSHRSILIVAFAFTLTASCGKAKSFESVSVRGPMNTQQSQPVNAFAAGGELMQLRNRALAFSVGSVRAAEQPPSLSVEPRSVVTSTPMVATTAEPTSLPPDWVIQRESGGDYNAVNPTGCGGAGCFGRYQFSGEWAGKLGLPEDLSTATPEQQDEAARQLWANGAGCSHWAAC